MRQSVIHLESFYASRLGQAAQAMVMRRLSTVWPEMAGREVLGFGYCYPYLEPFFDRSKRTALAMPGQQGAAAYRSKRGVVSCLVDELALPFEDAQFDNVLVAHGAEEARDLNALMTELWRVTKPEGRIIIIASNRAGLWARSDNSPFGAGQPFSRTQLRRVLKGAGFVPTIWSGALYIPPLPMLASRHIMGMTETFGETVWPGFSGLVLVEAVKRLYAEPSGRVRQKTKTPIFGTAPIGNSASRNEYE